METGKRLAGLDHLRAFAITAVFLFHYRMFGHPEWVDNVAGFGWTGVDLFFVLSGFLIAGQLFAQADAGKLRLKEFFAKRFFRILPPYWTVLLLYFCIPAFREREALPPLWKFLTFTQNFGLNVIDRGTFSHAWSLCIEEQFYLALPLLLPVFAHKKIWSRHVLPFLLTALILVAVLRLFSWYVFVAPVLDTDEFWREWYRWIYYPTYTRLDGLLLGVGLAALCRQGQKSGARIARNGGILFFIGSGLLTGAYFLCEDPYSFPATIAGFTLVALGYGFWVASAAGPGSFLNRRSWFVSRQLADLSYSIYLTHKGIIRVTQDFLESRGIAPDSNVALLGCAVACIATGLIFCYTVEWVSLRLRNRVLQRL